MSRREVTTEVSTGRVNEALSGGEPGRLPSRNTRMGVDQVFLKRNTCKGAEEVTL